MPDGAPLLARFEPHASLPQLLNPLTKETKEAFVLLRVAEYKQLTTAMYDDSPWTRDELAAVAWETADGLAGTRRLTTLVTMLWGLNETWRRCP